MTDLTQTQRNRLLAIHDMQVIRAPYGDPDFTKLLKLGFANWRNPKPLAHARSVGGVDNKVDWTPTVAGDRLATKMRRNLA